MASTRVAAVTGATGFVGWNLAESLRDDGWSVRAPVRPESDNPLPEGIERVTAHLTAPELMSAFDGVDVVVHLAGLTRARDYESFCRVNEEGARQVGVAAVAANVPIVNVSSLAASGPGTPDRPRREKDEPEPVSAYGCSKLAGERALGAIAGLRCVHLRPAAIYGPRDADFLAVFRLVSKGLYPILDDPTGSYTLAHVGDVVGSIRVLAERIDELTGDALFVGHPRPRSKAEIGHVLSEVLGRRCRSPRIPKPALRLLAEIGEMWGRVSGRPGVLNRSRYRELTAPGFVCSVDRLRERTGFEARMDLEQGFAETADWYRREGML